jgi:hypothetical protein
MHSGVHYGNAGTIARLSLTQYFYCLTLPPPFLMPPIHDQGLMGNLQGAILSMRLGLSFN